ncbi:hypothetical protein LZ32DRAFT_279318 [Colletotrichum eremochloae]|nr:hypothetical protein LZ32DRAFT_279318 [Colletotrichum eremochloae]
MHSPSRPCLYLKVCCRPLWFTAVLTQMSHVLWFLICEDLSEIFSPAVPSSGITQKSCFVVTDSAVALMYPSGSGFAEEQMPMLIVRHFKKTTGRTRSRQGGHAPFLIPLKLTRDHILWLHSFNCSKTSNPCRYLPLSRSTSLPMSKPKT